MIIYNELVIQVKPFFIFFLPCVFLLITVMLRSGVHHIKKELTSHTLDVFQFIKSFLFFLLSHHSISLKYLSALINNQVEITPNNPAKLITSTLLVVNIVYKHAITIIHNINLNISFSSFYIYNSQKFFLTTLLITPLLPISFSHLSLYPIIL